MTISGKVWKYENDVNTDVIFPGKYTYTIKDPEEMAKYALEDLDSNFAKEVQPNDIIVAGTNWGCGSSREQAATCVKMSGVGAIIAKSFSRLYFRSALNQGLPIIVCPEIVDKVEKGDTLTVDLESGTVKLEKTGETFSFPPLPSSIMDIFDAGGLIPYARKKLGIDD